MNDAESIFARVKATEPIMIALKLYAVFSAESTSFSFIFVAFLWKFSRHEYYLHSIASLLYVLV